MDNQETLELSSRLEDEFVCLSGLASNGVWYIDSRVSSHTTGVREYFLSYQEEHMDFQITTGNKTKCTLVRRGIVDFQMETRTSTRATNVLHVTGFGMNLISMSQLQDKVYDVYFVGKKVYVKHPTWKKVR